METKSVVINFAIRVFSKINVFYEYSFIYQIISFFSKLLDKSSIFQFFKKGIAVKTKRNYLEGSLVLKTIVFLFAMVISAVKTVFLFMAKANQKGISKSLFTNMILPLKNGVNLVTAVSCGLFGMAFCLVFYNSLVHFNITYLIISIVLCIITFITGFFINEEIAMAVKNSLPVRLLLSFFSEL